MRFQAGLRRCLAVVLALLAVIPGLIDAAAATSAPTAAPRIAPGGGSQTSSDRSSTRLMGEAGCGGFTQQHKQWKCTFDDEFSPVTKDAHRLRTGWWRVQRTADSAYTTGPPGRQACYLNDPNNVWVNHGSLHLRALKLPRPFACFSLDALGYFIHDGGSFRTQYSSGMVSTWDRFAQRNGRFAVRAKVPATTMSGLQETLWLFPSNPRKYGGHGKSGEIDFAEFFSRYSKLAVPNIHYLKNNPERPPSYDPNLNDSTAHCTIRRGKFNTYVTEWSPGRIKITVNGKTCLIDRYQAFHIAPPAPFDQPFFVALTQALGTLQNAFSPRYTPLPATTQVDWVRVWRRSESG
jgi:hypothetical protein